MSRVSLNPRRLIVLLALMALFAIKQLSRQTLTLDLGTVTFLVASLAVSLFAVMTNGTEVRLIALGY
jgi:hypothetical protein